MNRTVRTILTVLALVAATAGSLRWIVLRPKPVTVAEVVRGDLNAEIEGTGTVTADAIADIASKITGRVERVSADEGDLVKTGEIVATLDDTALRRRADAARARLDATLATELERRREWMREAGLVNTGAASVEDTQQYEEHLAVARSAVAAARAEAAEANYDLSLVHIPSLFPGIVTKRWVVPGASVVAGQVLFTVADTRLVYVKAYIDQDYTGMLAKGQNATVVLRGREDHPLEGHVLRMSPEADAQTEETVAEVQIPVSPEDFQLGQWANVFVRVGEVKDELLVPRTALMEMNGKMSVFVVAANGVLRDVPVRILAQSPRLPLVAVRGALQVHDRVVLAPMGLAPGKRVRILAVKNVAPFIGKPRT